MKCIAHSIEYCSTCTTYQPPTPFSASFEGYTANPDDLEQWPNTVTVEAVEHWSIGQRGEVEEPIEKYADFGDVRQLVEIDTNYKPGRPGQHPVRLTRADAMTFAAAVLRATGDTFHYSRCGQLRPAEAAELLQALREIEVELDEIREHALADLLDGTGLGEDQPDEPEPASSDGPAEEAAAATSVGAGTAGAEPGADSRVARDLAVRDHRFRRAVRRRAPRRLPGCGGRVHRLGRIRRPELHGAPPLPGDRRNPHAGPELRQR